MQGNGSVEGVEARVVGVVVGDQGGLFEVEGGWGWVCEDQGLDREGGGVEARLGDSGEGDVDAGVGELGLAFSLSLSLSLGVSCCFS